MRSKAQRGSGTASQVSGPCGLPGECPLPPPVLRSGAPGERTEVLLLRRLGGSGLPSPGPTWEQPQAARLSRAGALCPPHAPSPPPSLRPLTLCLCLPGLVEGLRKRLLPAWCAPLAHGLSLLLVAGAVGVSGWVGASFPPGVSVMWLLSSGSSFLASFLGWEPLKVSGMQGPGCQPLAPVRLADATPGAGAAGSPVLLTGGQAAAP